MNIKVERFLKHYLLIIVWWAYFWIYSQYKNTFIDYIKESFWYGDILFWYFNALIGAFMVYSIITLLEKWIEKMFHTIFSLTKNETHETIAKEFVIQFLDIFKFYGTLYIFFRFIHLSSRSQIIVDKTASILLVIILIFFTTTLLKIVFEKWVFGNIKAKNAHWVLPFITRLISVIIWGIWIIFIISNLGYDISAIVAWAGIWGIAIALAAQKSLTNVFWAINIMLNKPFKIGDMVQINTFKGVVRDISLSYVTIVDQEGHQVMIPNETIITTSIENFSQRENRKVEFTIWVWYTTSNESLKDCIEKIESILKKYETSWEVKERSRVFFEEFAQSSLNIKVVYFSLINNDIRAFEKQKEKINIEIKEMIEQNNISIPYPIQEVIIKDSSKKKLKL